MCSLPVQKLGGLSSKAQKDLQTSHQFSILPDGKKQKRKKQPPELTLKIFKSNDKSKTKAATKARST